MGWSKWWFLAWLAVVAAAGGAVGVVHAVVIAEVAIVYRGAALLLLLGFGLVALLLGVGASPNTVRW